MEIKGTIEVIFDEQVISDSFKKREFVLRYADNPDYPELIKLEFVQDKTVLLDSYKVGQDVTVAINLRGRKWTDPQGVDKYFNTLVAWKIDGAQVPTLSVKDVQVPGEADDLPF
jgi:hypothetical protein